VSPRASLDDLEEKNLHPTETETPTPRSSSPYPVAILTNPFRLLYNICNDTKLKYLDFKTFEMFIEGPCNITGAYEDCDPLIVISFN
jgi:hypothetical protein